VRIAVWLLGLLFVYQYTGFVLRQFPYTRPWGETLRANLFAAVGGFASSLLHALPGLLFVVLIFMLARAIVRALRVFFAAVKSGRVHVPWVDEVTATPTERMVIVLVWLFALVAAYPYIPGSESEAFKGVGVFVGLMLSIGSSGIVNQAVSGLMLMYTRLLRPGEFVRIGDTEGTVTTVGFLTTRLETLRHEEVSIPNSVISSSTTRNFSRLAADGNLQITTRSRSATTRRGSQVHAFAARGRRSHQQLADAPAPRVLQSGLMDFYVQYTLIVAIVNPRSVR
jgi:small-conductance mechanosensitive channel